MEFKERLALLRKEKHLNQEEFAKKLGYTRTAISAWEVGRNEPSNADTIKIADFFNVSVDYLLGKSDVRKPETQNEDLLDLAKVGFTRENYKPPSDKQKEQIRTILETILEDNKKDNKNDNN